MSEKTDKPIKSLEEWEKLAKAAEYDMYLQECPTCGGSGRVSRHRLQDSDELIHEEGNILFERLSVRETKTNVK